jgi:cell wall-associated protease
MSFKKMVMALAFCLPVLALSAQSKAPESWFNLDPVKDKVNGTGGDEALRRLKEKGKKGQTVIVAVLDSGVDTKHEDLKDVMWVNPGEIAGNGKDDDNNGYIDDIHGWNFIGGKNGENVSHDSYELTREYVRLSKRFKDTDPKNLHGAAKKEYEDFLAIKASYEEKRGELEGQKKQFEEQFGKIEAAFKTVEKAIGKKNFTVEELGKINAGDNAALKEAVATCQGMMAQGLTPETLADEKAEASQYFEGGLKYGYNPDFNPRNIVGDNYEDLSNRFYGNNVYDGPDAFHGTHVAGIIAAKRNNGVGINGVADNVRIMTVRCVPDGDERDKDVANAIYYAVDNGASVINMSFGKAYSPNKAYVDAAMKYAADHDVLLVHAAGNDAENNDSDPNFPNDMYDKPVKKGLFKKEKNVDTWMEIGALSFKTGEKLLANFSNYGKKNVDLFSPGVALYSTIPGSKYGNASGTSMACPAAAGVAAILRSYYPDLSATQIKGILESSVIPQEGEIYKPGTTEKVKMNELCVTGGIISATNAVEMAEKTKAKKFKKAVWREAGMGKTLKREKKGAEPRV